MQLIHAFTDPDPGYLPPFVNATRLEDGSVRVAVRSPGAGTPSEIVMSEGDWRSFVASAHAEIKTRAATNKPPEPSTDPGKV